MSIYKEVFKTSSELNQKEITKNSEDILKMRYFIEKDDGTKETTFSQLCRRVSRILTSADTSKDIEYKKNIEKSIYNDMLSQRFLFNSPCLFNAGVGISKNPKLSKYLYSDEVDEETYEILRKNISSNQQLFACFVVSFKDSLEDIFEAIKRTAIISKSGGGVGANLCRLRENGATIKDGELGVSSGPISFMNNFNECLKSVSQAGKRRGAGMLMLDSSHPDIKEFIDSKTEEGVLSNVNISVSLDNKFMKAVKENADYCLISPKDGAVVKTIKARDLYNAICENAWKRGDPGIFFRDMSNQDSLLKLNKDFEIFSTNPCFVGDTLITMSDGSQKRIDEIVIGDKVLTYDILADKVEIETVQWSGKTKDTNDLVRLYGTDCDGITVNKEIICTPEHKILTTNKGYVEAKDILETDEIIMYSPDQINGELRRGFYGIKVIDLNNPDDTNNSVPVYDITTEKNHNFFANGILVHNCR